MRWTRLTLVYHRSLRGAERLRSRAMFVVEPSGRVMGMTEAALVRSPFRSYLVFGIVLFVDAISPHERSSWMRRMLTIQRVATSHVSGRPPSRMKSRRSSPLPSGRFASFSG